jgi:hypothetical protein
MKSARFTYLALGAAAVLAAACSDVSNPLSAPDTPSFAKSGTAPSGGGGGGGGGGGKVSTDSSTNSPASPSGIPIAPSYTARIDSIGVVPTAMYYGTPSTWTIGGYVFQASYLTHLKPLNGPLVVGACVSVTFTEYDGVYNTSEIKTEQQSKCN